MHCDIKPANLMFVTHSDKTVLQVIDFGQISSVMEAGQRMRDISSEKPRGTLNYMSRNCHRGIRMSRKDDMESVVYILLAIVNGSLPWQNLTDTVDADANQRVLEMKEKLWGDKLLEGLPFNIQHFVLKIMEMNDDEDPPYDQLIEMMKEVETETGTFEITDGNLCQIEWNEIWNHEEYSIFKDEAVIMHRNQLPCFEFLHKDEIEDFEMLEQRPFQLF